MMKFIKSKWWFIGLFYGFFMWFFNGILFPLAEGNNLTIKRLIIEMSIWLIVGMIIGRLIVASNQKSAPKQYNG